VAVQFEASDERVATVGAAAASCTLPCVLPLSPGCHGLWARGRELQIAAIEIDSTPPRVALHVPVPGHRYAAYALIPSGIVIGASLWALAYTCPLLTHDFTCLKAHLIG
jgi:hypothetical protein